MTAHKQPALGKKRIRKYIILFVLAVLVYEGWRLFGNSIMSPFVDNGSSLFE